MQYLKLGATTNSFVRDVNNTKQIYHKCLHFDVYLTPKMDVTSNYSKAA